MFVGHDASARRAADALTLLTTCRKMGVEPRGYLRDTLRKILAGERDAAALSPETFARAAAAAEAAARAAAEAAWTRRQGPSPEVARVVTRARIRAKAGR